MGRSPCCEKKNGLKKGPWTPEEDTKLIDYINKYGYGNWRTLPKNAGLQRCGKSCRLRWTNYLRPDIKRGRFSFEEEEIIIQLHSIMGNKWSAIAARLPGRTDNEIKNYWNTHIRKRLLKMGIDPVTHSPRLDLLDFSSILSSSSLYNSPYHHQHMNMSRSIIGPNYPEILKLTTSLFSNQNHTSETQIEQNQYQSGYSMVGNQELQSWFPEFQELMPMAPSNYDQDCSKTNFVFEPFYSDLTSVLTTSTSSPTPLNSSSTTYINSSTEDEKESYQSNNNIMNISQISDYLLDDNSFMQFQETKNYWDRVM